MKPPVPLLDKRFDYVPSWLTDIRVRFEAERDRLKAEVDRREHVIISILRKRA